MPEGSEGIVTRIAIYARYSSDQQRSASIDDQLRVCRAHASAQGWNIVQEYTDAAVSGVSLARPGMQSLIRDAMTGTAFSLVLAESLDRFSRDQEDTAGLFKRFTFAGVRIITLSEGEIGFLHVGLKGTMNALYLKDLAEKTRRGLRGRVDAGKSGGGLCYGYRVVRVLEGQPRGEREIHPEEAALVRRIFTSFVDGVSPKAIVRQLNAEGVPGPAGSAWSPSTIHGNAGRGTGILNNELYVGRLIWNRLRYVKDPDTGRRVSRLNPPSLWVTSLVPELRIIDDDAWTATKARQSAFKRTTGNIGRLKRPKYLFSGLTRCAVCRGGFCLASHDRLVCYNARERGTCSNRRAVNRQELERRVLTAMSAGLMNPVCFEEYCRSFQAEIGRLRREHHAQQAGTKREIAAVDRRIASIVAAIGDGFRSDALRTELSALESKRASLVESMSVPEVPPLQPVMAQRFRAHVTSLTARLDADQSDSARQALRAYLKEILIPAEGRFGVVGNFEAMLRGGSGDLIVGSNVGCGGPQQIVPAALLGGSVTVNTLAFLTEVPGARRLSLG
jgi:DNA invertase Pin-like site-specific DNA recombinase